MYWNREELKKLPTLAQGQADDLKIDTGNLRVWLSRVDDTISIEQLVDGKWELVSEGD